MKVYCVIKLPSGDFQHLRYSYKDYNRKTINHEENYEEDMRSIVVNVTSDWMRAKEMLLASVKEYANVIDDFLKKYPRMYEDFLEEIDRYEETNTRELIFFEYKWRIEISTLF